MFPIQEVSDGAIALGVVNKQMLPPYDSIPREFKRAKTKWNRIIDRWFYSGHDGMTLFPKESVDSEKAFRHIRCILNSYLPHERKLDTAAYLLAEWFEDAELVKHPKESDKVNA